MNLAKPWKSLSCLLAVGLGLLTFPVTALVAQETWTDVSGEKTLTAEFVKLEGVQLTLKKADGKEIVLPLSKLDDKSRLKARAIARDGGVSDSASAKPPVALPSDATAQEFLDVIVREVQNKNAIVLWDALPASKQNQVQEIVKLASTKIEQKTLNLIKKFRSDLLAALRSKKQFVLNSRVIPVPPDQRAVLAGSYDALVALIEAYVPAEWMDTEYLEKTPIRDLLSGYMNKIVRKANDLEKSVPNDSPIKAMLGQNSGAMSATAETISSNEATVTLLAPGVPGTPMKFVLSEGRWLPKDLLDNWDQAMALATGGLQAANPKDIHLRVGQAIFGANAFLGTITSAETQEDFDDQLGQLIGMAGGMGGPAGPGRGPGGPGPGRGGPGGPGPAR